MFTPQQIEKLSGKLPTAAVKTRAGNGGRKLAYVEGWYIIDTANDIFGFGNWDAETINMTMVHEPTLVQMDNNSGGKDDFVVVTYEARVRVTVRSEDGTRSVVRERCGAHRGFAKTAGEACENTIKAAETDALKRAFMTFGNIFGLTLYDKEQRNVGDDKPAARQLPPPPMAPIDVGFGDTMRGRISQRAQATIRKPAAGVSF